MLDAFVLDKSDILERLGGDEEIYSMMVDMYLQDVDGNCLAIETACASGLAVELQREAHTIKGLLATFSDAAGTAAAYALEQRVKGGDLSGAADAVAELKSRLQEVAGVLKTQGGLG